MGEEKTERANLKKRICAFGFFTLIKCCLLGAGLTFKLLIK